MSTGWTSLLWVDLLGREQVVRVPTANIETPVIIDRRLVTAALDGSSADDGAVMLVADLTTRRVRPTGGDDLVLATIRELDGSPSPLCARSVLAKVVGDASQMGLEVRAAVELEFYLLDQQSRQPAWDINDCYGMPRSARFEEVLEPMRNLLPGMGIQIEASNLEYSGGQVEVNIRYGPALSAADNGLLLRMMAREIAGDAAYDVTFMAKPWTERSGSGMHVHQSLWRGERNAFATDGAHGLSSTGSSYVAGLLERMAELTLLGSRTVNAYRRRTDDSFSPTVICWGSDNRTLAVRSIAGSEAATRVEQRDAAADCNIHLTLAGQIAAGLSGVHRGLEPPAAVTGNAYTTDLPRLPRSFADAFEGLGSSTFAREALGELLIDKYLEVLRPELELGQSSVGEWERGRYLDLGPSMDHQSSSA